MGNLANILPVWEPNIFQIETNDPVIGGAPNPGTGAGTNNIAALQLANRTAWLKAGLDTVTDQLGGADPLPVYLNAARGDLRYYTQAQIDALVAASTLPPGAVLWIAGPVVPTSFIEAFGALVSRATYPELFDAIGTTYGAGDGATTFGLPDLRGEFIRGVDAGRGIDPGRSLGSYQADQLSAHEHDFPVFSGIAGTSAGSQFTVPSNISFGTPTNNSVSTSSTGGGDTHPRNLALLPIIRY